MVDVTAQAVILAQDEIGGTDAHIDSRVNAVLDRYPVAARAFAVMLTTNAVLLGLTEELGAYVNHLGMLALAELLLAFEHTESETPASDPV